MNIHISTKGVQDILGDVDGWKHAFDLDRDDLGLALLDAAAFEVLAAMDAETDPDGMPWPDLSPGYADWKGAVVGDKPMGVLYGHMKTWEQVAGERVILEAAASMTYGVDALAKEECDKFSMGGLVTGTRQPQREFYGLTYQAVARCDDILDRTFYAR